MDYRTAESLFSRMLFHFINKKAPLLVALFFMSFLSLAEEGEVLPPNENYKIQPGDVLIISVLNEADFEKEVRVSANGTVLYPLIGEVAVKGLDILSVTQKITGLLNEYLVEPQVSIFIKQFSKVFVYGEVIKPGSFELSEKMTLLQSISLAGGIKDRANPKKIKIKRVKEGKIITIGVDLTSITQKEQSDQDVVLEPGDVVIVPESFL